MAFVALSLFLLGVLGVGWLASRLVIGKATSVFTALACGLAVNYGLGILGFSLVSLNRVLMVGALFGAFVGLARLRRHRRTPLPWKLAHVFFGVVFLVVFLNTLFCPLWAGGGDARSIWFFHARIIYFDGGLQQGHWTNPVISFSQVDYPKLVALLGAQIATFVGFWNEYIPKLSLFILFITACSGLFELRRRLKIPLWGITLLFLVVAHFLWNGYMDGYLGLFAAIGFTAITCAIREKDPDALQMGIASLMLCTYLKNEGVALLLSAALPAVILLFRSRWAYIASLRPLPLLLPALLWSLKSRAWGIHPHVLQGGSLSRALERLSSLPSFFLIIRNVWLSPAQIVFGSLLGCLIVFRKRLKWTGSEVFASSAYVIYGGILTCIYLTTIYDLKWHLSTSASRVVMPLIDSLILSILTLIPPATQPASPQALGRHNRGSGRLKRLSVRRT